MPVPPPSPEPGPASGGAVHPRHRRATGRRFGTLRRLAVGLALCLASLGHALPVGAEIFKWKDADGRLHFAQDLNQVPARYRAQARSGVLGDGDGPAIQRYQAPPAAAAPRRAPSKPQASGQVHRIRVERAGTMLRVRVRLNDQLVAPFYVDTGASDVVLPRWVAEELRLETEGGRTAFYGTANGVIQQSLVTLDSVELGGARAERVPAAINDSMSVGLLGLSFFNHFQYRVDPAAGVITLRSNGLVEAGVIRGGRSRAQWRSQFAGLAARRAAIERELDEINPNWSRRKAELEGMIEEVERQLAVLEDEADEARVPMQWRD